MNSREIKFRGRRSDTKEWVYGHYYVAVEGIRICHCIVENRDTKYYVDYDSIGQFTGLKDMNGKEIYEGDVVEYKNTKYKICWSPEGMMFFAHLITKTGHFLNAERMSDCEVIGNIYQEKVIKN